MLGNIAFFLLLLITVCEFSKVKYCKQKYCKKNKHTMCRFPTSSPSKKCRKVIGVGLTDDEKDEILQIHNDLRQQVARGEETRGNPGPQPAASEMPDLEWDYELAKIAQRWVIQCKFKHDKCRDVDRFQVGQNLAYLETTGGISSITLKEVILSWYDEVQDFDKEDVHKYKLAKSKSVETGHYTQMVWANTTLVGCGLTKYATRKEFNRVYLGCNYGPAGNLLESAVYHVEEPEDSEE